MKQTRLILVTLALALGLAAGAAAAPVPTKVMVRVVAHDAKLLSDHVGGARVTLRDAATGTVLAQGIQEGGSGDTELIMRRPRERGAAVYDTPEAAGFLATLNLDQPTVVEITAEGPLAFPQATQRVSTTLLLVPGHDVLGDGVVLEVHGFIVELLAPAKDAPLKPSQSVEVRARVRLA